MIAARRRAYLPSRDFFCGVVRSCETISSLMNVVIGFVIVSPPRRSG
ncbi:MAG: hypothetical protein ACK55I_21925 [bacterium]